MKAIRRLPRASCLFDVTRVCVLVIDGEIGIVIFFEITEVLAIVNIVGIRIGLGGGLFLLLAFELRKQEATATQQDEGQNAHQGEHILLFLFFGNRFDYLRRGFRHGR